MHIHFGIDTFPVLPATVVTSGTFDGVHLGHRQILQRLCETAAVSGSESVVITYHPHPRIVLGKDHDLKLLSTFQEKTDLLAAAGIQHLLVIPFDKKFSERSSEEFIQQVLIHTLHTQTLVIGYDHRFGKNREGSFEYLKTNAHRYGFAIHEIPAQEVDDMTVSSSKIRNALLAGNVGLATELLGRPYAVSGKVVKGKQLGRTIGYPTANIEVADAYKLIPRDGVYAVRVSFENRHFGGMLSIGNNPTVNGQFRTIEVYLFDFEGDLYDKTLTVSFVAYLREQVKYPGLPQLIAQLEHDETDARKILGL